MKSIEIRGSHSGHTLVAAALDCHPNIIIANRYGAPITIKQILASKNDTQKWVGNKYSFIHPDQLTNKEKILWLGNTGRIEAPDRTIWIIRNPYVMAYSLLKKHKSIEAVMKFILNMFKQVEEKIFYEDIIINPKIEFIKLGCTLELNVTKNWLEAASSLVKTNIKQPKLDINLDNLFNNYTWLQRYAYTR